MSERAGIGRRAGPLMRRELLSGAGREEGAWPSRRARAVAECPETVVAAMQPPPPVPGLVSMVGASRALDVSAATVRRRIRTGELAAERVIHRGGTVWMVALPDAASGGPELRVLPSTSPPRAELPARQVVRTVPDAGGGLAIWCTLASLAEQLAAEAEHATAALAAQAAEHARANRRAGWLISGLALMVAGLGALLLVLGPLATIGRLRA